MQTNILWTGIEYYSLENCLIDTHGGVTVNSAILGFYEEKLYRVEYAIKLNGLWQVYYCAVKSQFDDEVKVFEFENDGDKWTLNGVHHPEFNGCTDVDIPLTPFTNSLPINRLRLQPGEEREIDVVYIDLLAHDIRHVKQKYRRISADTYHYENIPNDFEAEIKVDDAGFVIDYPQLFTRTARIPSKYRQG